MDVRVELLRQPAPEQPAGDRGHRRAGQHEQPAQRLAGDDEVHADTQHHAADQAADDPEATPSQMMSPRETMEDRAGARPTFDKVVVRPL